MLVDCYLKALYWSVVAEEDRSLVLPIILLAEEWNNATREPAVRPSTR